MRQAQRRGKAVRPVPLAVALAVVEREIARRNREEGRKGRGARGRSYEQMFRAGLTDRVLRKPTAQQLYYTGLVYTPASVDRWGREQVAPWTYGDPEPQDAFLRLHGKGQTLIGRAPGNFEVPAVAFDETGRLICKDIMPVKAGVYGSVDGAREAAKNRKAARDAVRRAHEANAYLDDAAFAPALADLGTGDAEEVPLPPAKVIGACFGGFRPNRAAAPAKQSKAKSALTAEMLRNLDRAIGFDLVRPFGK
jgi:putative transposase